MDVKMIVEVTGLELAWQRAVTSRKNTGDRFPPIRGNIKRKIFTIFCEKLRFANQFMIYYLRNSNNKSNNNNNKNNQ